MKRAMRKATAGALAPVKKYVTTPSNPAPSTTAQRTMTAPRVSGGVQYTSEVWSYRAWGIRERTTVMAITRVTMARAVGTRANVGVDASHGSCRTWRTYVRTAPQSSKIGRAHV